jgi:hypothetical protein
MESSLQAELNKITMNEIFEKYGEEKAKNIIIGCIDKKFLKDVKPETKSKMIEDIQPNICNICESQDFYITNSEEICRECGNVHRIIYNSTTFKKQDVPQFLEDKENKVKMIIDGKEVKVDLNKVSKYTLNKLTPHQRIFKLGADNIEDKLEKLQIDYTTDELNLILKIYWNITLYYTTFKNVKPSIKSEENKKVYQVLSIYYSFKESGRTFNLYRILDIFDITLTNLEYFNKILKVILKDSSLESMLLPQIQQVELIVSTDKNLSSKVDKIIQILLDNKIFKVNSQDLYASAYLYISRNILKNTITIVDVQKQFNLIGTIKINKMYQQIANFFTINKKLLLFI